MIYIIRKVERLKVEKARPNKYHKKDKVAFVEIDENNKESDRVFEYVEETEVNLAELKP